jgi:tRNA-dihydrouridine synthase B
MLGTRSELGNITYFQGSSFAIGPVVVPNRVVLTSMSGITDAPFRRLAERLGAGLVVSEMTGCAGPVRGEREAAVRSDGAGIRIHVVQLAGCEARWMAEGARIAEAQGSERSRPRSEPDRCTTVSAVRVPVTLKMRLGWDASTINAPELAKRAEAAGIKLITVHGRTRCQFFQDQPDWRAVRMVKEAVSIPIVVNGDIRSCADAINALADSGGDAVMMGCAVQGRPWLPGQVARYFATGMSIGAPPLTEQFNLIDALYDEMLRHHGAELGRRHARKHLGWVLDSPAATAGAPVALLKQHRSRILTTEEPARARRLLAEAYNDFSSRAAA